MVHSAPAQWADPAPKKVACIGASITWGYWLQLPIREKTYPDFLAKLLGPGYQVRNYGFGGATAGVYAGETTRAYINSGEQVGTRNWQPDFIIGGLGVNDCNPSWVNPAAYEQGYRDLISSWRTYGRNPSIWLWNRLTPDFRGPLGVAAFPGNVFGPSKVFPLDDVGTAANRPALQLRVENLAAELGLGTVNALSLLMNRPEWGGDGLHLIEPGLKRLAQLNYCRIWETKAKAALPLLSEVVPLPGSNSPTDEWGTRPPWVELYNPYEFGVCLDGLALDAGPSTPRFDFINSSVLEPGERRIVFLSGRYSQDPTRNFHTNFTASNMDGQVRLLARNGEVADAIGWGVWSNNGSLGRADRPATLAVDSNSSHQRLVTTSPPMGWEQPGFNASGWISGTGGVGQELPSRSENQFSKRWNCDTSPTGVWTLANGSSGWSSQADGIYRCSGIGTGATVPAWISSADSSWTVEVRLQLNGTQTGVNQGCVVRGGTQHVGGAYTYLFIQSDRVVFGTPYENGFVLSTQANNDGYHVFRMAYHAATRRFFVWRDGVEITGRTGGLTRDSSRFNWLTMGAVASTQTEDAMIDYASYDLSGAYCPTQTNGFAPAATADKRPLVTDPTIPGSFDVAAATCLVRIPFNAGTDSVTGIKLKMEFDDGFRAWINGTEVALCNAPASGTVAPASRDDSRSFEIATLDLSAYAALIVPGNNLLAIQAYNANDSDGSCFVRASLELQGPADASARYFAAPTAAVANGAGGPLPAYGWLLEPQYMPMVIENPMSLVADSDLDGRSNLLEYAQGTNPGLPDAAPVITESQGAVSFLWRDNPEIGWRLMEQVDASNWRPAAVTGSPSIAPAAAAGMMLVTCAVPEAGKTYRLAAVDEPTLATWQQRHFNQAEIDAGLLTSPDADPDADGLPNHVEFAVASDPRRQSWGLFNMVPGKRAISFPDPGTTRGTTWKLYSSSGLSLWNQVANPEITGCFINSATGEYRLITTDPALPPSQGFLRLGFSRSAP